MLLPREFVTYLSRQIVRRLSPGTIETHTPEKVVELVHGMISDELAAEDKLNDEVRDILEAIQRLHAPRRRQLSGDVPQGEEPAGAAAEDREGVGPRHGRRHEAFARQDHGHFAQADRG